MRDNGKERRRETGKAANGARRERLKLALRENLKRRKSQARGRDDFTVSSSDSDDVAPSETNRSHPGK